MPESPYLQRAELLADLGQYEDAAAELAEIEPADAPAQALLARLHLATGEMKPALAAADAAVAAAGNDATALATRGMVLAELGRVDEAVQMAERILRHGRGDGYACTSAAAILAEARVGQLALDAAWEGVRLQPDQPRAHLVLGVVAARLGLTDVAERAHREALELAPQLADGERALGLARQELHHYATLLERYTGPGEEDGGHARSPRTAYWRRPQRPANGSHPGGPGPSGESSDPAERGHGGRAGGPDETDPAGGSGLPDAGPSRDDPDIPGMPGYPEVPEIPDYPDLASDDHTGGGQVHRLLRYGTGYAVVAPLAVVWADATETAAPLVALLLAGLGMVGVTVGFRRLSPEAQAALPAAVAADRSLKIVLWVILLVPLQLMLYTLLMSPWPLVVAVAIGVVGVFANRSRRPLP